MSSKQKGQPRPRQGAGRVTLSDVAALLGITKMTVSRALHSPHLVSEKTLERVKDAVQQMGYMPDLVAGSLASNRSRLVIALVPSTASGVFRHTLPVLSEKLSAAGYQLLVAQTNEAGANFDVSLEAVIGRRPAAIVIGGVVRAHATKQKLLSSGIPVLEMWDTTRSPVDMLIGFSHAAVGKVAAAHVAAKACTKPVVVSSDDEWAQKRSQSFRSAFRGVRAIPAVTVAMPATLGDIHRTLLKFFHENPDVDSIFCADDVCTLAVLLGMRRDAPKIPKDVQLIGFSDQELIDDDVGLPLTTIRANGAEIGAVAAEKLIARLDHEAKAMRRFNVAFSTDEAGY